MAEYDLEALDAFKPKPVEYDEGAIAAANPKNPFLSTVKSTGAEMVKSTLGQPVEDIGRATGIEPLERGGKAVSEWAEGVQERNPSHLTEAMDIVRHPVTAAEEALGNVAPQLAGSLASAKAGAMLGSKLAPGDGKTKALGGILGGFAGLAAPSLMQEYTAVREKQDETGQENIPSAIAHAVPAAALDVVPDVVLGGRFMPKPVRETLGKLVEPSTLKEGASRLAHVGKEALKGVAAEAPTEYAQTLLEQHGGGQDITTEPAHQEQIMSAALGGIGGAAIRGGMSAFDAREEAAPPNKPPVTGDKTRELADKIRSGNTGVEAPPADISGMAVPPEVSLPETPSAEAAVDPVEAAVRAATPPAEELAAMASSGVVGKTVSEAFKAGAAPAQREAAAAAAGVAPVDVAAPGKEAVPESAAPLAAKVTEFEPAPQEDVWTPEGLQKLTDAQLNYWGQKSLSADQRQALNAERARRAAPTPENSHAQQNESPGASDVGGSAQSGVRQEGGNTPVGGAGIPPSGQEIGNIQQGAPETPASVERRSSEDAALRAVVDELSPEEKDYAIDHLRKALLTSEKGGGIGSFYAYKVAPKKPVQVSIDADSLKWVNDNFGHDQGDALLHAIGSTLGQVFGQDAFHVSGDEYIAQADSLQDAKTRMQAFREALKTQTLANGMQPQVSFGIGDGENALATAEQRLRADKARREARGLRAKRGEAPIGYQPSATVQAEDGEKQNPTQEDTTRQADEAQETQEVAAPVDEAGKLVVTHPENTQQISLEDEQAGKYAKAPVMFQGIPLAIENGVGSVRKGTDETGRAWEQKLKDNYGEITGVKGADKDHIDVFVKAKMSDEDIAATDRAFVVDQVNPKTGAFDEHKIILGAKTAGEARKIYLRNYEKGWQGLGHLTEMPMPDFKAWLASGQTDKPLAEARRSADAAFAALQSGMQQLKQNRAKIINTKTDDLMRAIIKLGGIKKSEAEKMHIDPQHWGKNTKWKYGEYRAFNEGQYAKSADHMAELLREKHYTARNGLEDDLTANELWDMVKDSVDHGVQYFTPEGYENLMDAQRKLDNDAEAARFAQRLEALLTFDLENDPNHAGVLKEYLHLITPENIQEFEDDIYGRETAEESPTPGAGEGEAFLEASPGPTAEKPYRFRSLTASELELGNNTAQTVALDFQGLVYYFQNAKAPKTGNIWHEHDVDVFRPGATVWDYQDMAQFRGDHDVRDTEVGTKASDPSTWPKEIPQELVKPIQAYVNSKTEDENYEAQGMVQEALEAIATASRRRPATQVDLFGRDDGKQRLHDIELQKQAKRNGGNTSDTGGGDLFPDMGQVDISDMPLFSRRARLAPNGKPSNLNAMQWRQVRTPEFKAWFGDWENDPANASKVVDENGEPLVVYHGTNQDFAAFEHASKSRKTGNPNAQLGFFFSTDTKEAGRYAEAWGAQGGTVVPVFVNLREAYRMPYKQFDDLAMGAFRSLMADPDYDPNAVVRFGDYVAQKKVAAVLERHHEKARQEVLKVQSALRAEGYDGALVKIGGGVEVIAFEPNQIKSAIGNTGAFSPTNPDVRYSRKAKSNLNPVQQRQVSAPSFKAWFKDSKAVDENGGPLVLYHGSTADFTKFDRSRANIESDVGGGFYFTNTPADVGQNYASRQGPDLDSKIQRTLEQLAVDIAEETGRDYDDPDVIEEAMAEAERIHGVAHGGIVLPVYLSLQNPAVIGNRGADKETYLDFEAGYNEETEDYEEPSGSLVDFINALDEGDFFGGDMERFKEKLFEEGMDSGRVSIGEILDVLDKGDYISEYIDEDGRVAGREIFRRALEDIGFDGIIDHSVDLKFGSQKRIGKPMAGMSPDTTHYIVFQPTQIKSAIGNSGAFDPNNPDIRYSRAEKLFAALSPRNDSGTIAAAQQKVEDHPLAERIQYIEKNFYSLLGALEQSGKVQIKC